MKTNKENNLRSDRERLRTRKFTQHTIRPQIDREIFQIKEELQPKTHTNRVIWARNETKPKLE